MLPPPAVAPARLFDALHDHDLLAVASGYFTVASGIDGRIVPVQIVDLHLDDVHLRVIREDLFQQYSIVVVGKTDLPDSSLHLELL